MNNQPIMRELMYRYMDAFGVTPEEHARMPQEGMLEINNCHSNRLEGVDSKSLPKTVERLIYSSSLSSKYLIIFATMRRCDDPFRSRLHPKLFFILSGTQHYADHIRWDDDGMSFTVLNRNTIPGIFSDLELREESSMYPYTTFVKQVRFWLR
eukprot:941461_1